MIDPGPVLRTERLRLRPWCDDDAAPFAALNADPRVARYLPGPLTRAESDGLLARIRAHFAQHGFGLWAVEPAAPPLPGTAGPSAAAIPRSTQRKADAVAPLLGFVGLHWATFPAPFTPCVEVGWRLLPAWWGQGIATEAARAALEHGFGTLGLAEIVSFTVPANTASLRVMAKLGLRRDAAGDFEHPALPPGHPLRRHVLYRLRSDEPRG